MDQFIQNVRTSTLHAAKLFGVCEICTKKGYVGPARPYPHVQAFITAEGMATLKVPQDVLNMTLECRGCGADARGIVEVDRNLLAQEEGP
jgi:hypothetical protein